MFRLIQTLFGNADLARGRYDGALVEEAVDRAIEATDPRIRALSAHRRRLAAAMPGAFDHVVALVDSLPPPAAAGPGNYGENPSLAAFFASGARMVEVFGGDATLREFSLTTEGALADPVLALLVMERSDRKVLGLALEGERVVSDVAQVVVSFDRHRLLDASGEAAKLRRALRRRAFDQLLAVALGRIAAAKGEHESLSAERSALRSKLRAFQSAGLGFAREADAGEGAKDPAAMQARLDEIEAELLRSGTAAGSLPRHLDLLVETLEAPGEHLKSRAAAVFLDRQGVRRDGPGEGAHEVRYAEISNSAGISVAAFPVAIPRTAIRIRDRFAEAAREFH